MLHQRKANLIQLGFEKDLTRIFRNEGKDKVVKPLCISLSLPLTHTQIHKLRSLVGRRVTLLCSAPCAP